MMLDVCHHIYAYVNPEVERIVESPIGWLIEIYFNFSCTYILTDIFEESWMAQLAQVSCKRDLFLQIEKFRNQAVSW